MDIERVATINAERSLVENALDLGLRERAQVELNGDLATLSQDRLGTSVAMSFLGELNKDFGLAWPLIRDRFVVRKLAPMLCGTMVSDASKENSAIPETEIAAAVKTYFVDRTSLQMVPDEKLVDEARLFLGRSWGEVKRDVEFKTLPDSEREKLDHCEQLFLKKDNMSA